MGRRINLRPKSINLPGLGIEDIDVEEIIGRPSQARGKKGPFGISPSTPTSPEEQQMAREMAAQVFGGGGSRKINIPGVGPIQMPSTAPGSLNEEQTREILNEVVSSRLEDPFGDPFEGLGDRMRESDDVIYELPENFKFPPSTSGNRGINPPLGKRADGSIIYLMDDDAMDILRSREITGASTSEETPTVPTPTGSYESSYIDWLESKPEPPTVRRAGRMPGGGPAYKRAQKKYKEDLANWEGSKPSRDTFYSTRS